MAINRTLYPFRSPEVELVPLVGTVTVAAGSAAPSTNVPFASVVRIATGSYRLDFQESWVSTKATFLQAHSANHTAVLSGSSSTGRTATFRLVSSGSFVDPNVPVDVSFVFFAKNSGV